MVIDDGLSRLRSGSGARGRSSFFRFLTCTSLFLLLCCLISMSNADRMRLKKIKYDNCPKTSKSQKYKVTVQRKKIKEPKEKEDKPGCYQLEIKLKVKGEEQETYNFRDLYALTEMRIGAAYSYQTPEDQVELEAECEAAFKEAKDCRKKIPKSCRKKKNRKNASCKEEYQKCDVSDQCKRFRTDQTTLRRYQGLEACEYSDEELANNDGKSPTCGGFGSCLFCGNQCDEVAEDSDKLASLRILRAKNKKNFDKGKTQELECDGGITKNHKYYQVEYCPPTEDKLLEHLNITKEEWDEIYQDGETLRLKLYLFNEPKVDGEPHFITQKVAERKVWLDDQGTLDDARPSHLRMYYMEDYKEENAIACIQLVGDMHRPKSSSDQPESAT